MEEKNLLFRFEDKNLAQNLLQTVGDLLKDSDAAEEKEMVKDFLQKVSEAMTFVAVGDTGVGKTSFLNRLFNGIVCGNEIAQPTIGIREIKGGAQEAELQITPYYSRHFVTDGEMQGISIVDTQGLDTRTNPECSEKIRFFVQKSDVLFVVFDALRIRSFNVWDFLEQTDHRKMVFVMTMCDRADAQTLENNRAKLQQYMKEAGIEGPIFMSAASACGYIASDSNVEALKHYVREQILGETPTLTKQQQNMQHLEGMLLALGNSFSLRKKQHESDKVILENINTAVDGFLSRNESVVNRLKSELRNIISYQIDAYQSEIIAKMDPLKIKERCPGGPSEVEAYLGAVNENYRNIMNTQISETTQEAVRKYCSDLQDVFEEATGFFRKRQNLLDAEDQFYGSLEKSKQEMLYESDTMMMDLSRFYEKLAGASEKLFMDIWKARGEYDATIQAKGKKGAIAGGAAGVGIGGIGTVVSAVLAHSALGAAAAAAGTSAAAAATATAGAAVTSALGAILWPVVGAVIGAVVISKIAKKMSGTGAEKDMWAVYEECVAEFKQEVGQIKSEMTVQVMQTVTEIFDREVRSMDTSFKDFRMAVNIDSRNIPLLEEKLQTVQNLMAQMEQLKRDREARMEAEAPVRNTTKGRIEDVLEYEAE